MKCYWNVKCCAVSLHLSLMETRSLVETRSLWRHGAFGDTEPLETRSLWRHGAFGDTEPLETRSLWRHATGKERRQDAVSCHGERIRRTQVIRSNDRCRARWWEPKAVQGEPPQRSAYTTARWGQRDKPANSARDTENSPRSLWQPSARPRAGPVPIASTAALTTVPNHRPDPPSKRSD